MRRLLLASLLSVMTSALIIGPALAWGPVGHAIIAEIAEARLTPAAAQAVAQLLSQDGAQHLDQIASWADAIRPSHPETGPWHFVDIPLSAQGYNAARDCPGGNCVVEQIQRWGAVLGDATVAPAERLIALKYVVHFVGDIHQPLHCETNFASRPPPNGDRGGNDVHLTYFGRSTNLHAVWDGGIIEEALHIRLEPNYARTWQQRERRARVWSTPSRQPTRQHGHRLAWPRIWTPQSCNGRTSHMRWQDQLICSCPPIPCQTDGKKPTRARNGRSYRTSFRELGSG